jgi:hypothetical protein
MRQTGRFPGETGQSRDSETGHGLTCFAFVPFLSLRTGMGIYRGENPGKQRCFDENGVGHGFFFKYLLQRLKSLLISVSLCPTRALEHEDLSADADN